MSDIKIEKLTWLIDELCAQSNSDALLQWLMDDNAPHEELYQILPK